jgi:ketol-acid reductoisomerase
MTESGIIEESAYYESLHETPFIANTTEKLFEMNRVISDTMERLFDHACKPLIADIKQNAPSNLVGRPLIPCKRSR